MIAYKKILIIGNSCGGKTYLSRNLAKKLGLPVFHVDSIQFDSQLQIKDHRSTNEILKIITKNETWIIDGFGPLDQLFERMNQADLIIFIDRPLWLHYFWAIIRSLQNIFYKKRSELPPDSSERSFNHNLKLIRNIYQVHTKMRPEMKRILKNETYSKKTLILKKIPKNISFLSLQ